MKLAIIENLEEISASEWNALVDGHDNPFVRYEFLHALETHGCVGQKLGWLPRHLTLRDDNNHLVAAAPLYAKTNSYGELVFDWAWADAYERSGRAYYPKLVSAIPYTPATGPRLLVKPGADEAIYRSQLVTFARDYAQQTGVSSLHWLFPEEPEMALLDSEGFMPRLGCQFHWRNRGYTDFDHFLSTFTSRRRKNVNKERRKVTDAGITISQRHGDELSVSDWEYIYPFYRDTFLFKGGLPTLTQEFFIEISRTMGRQLLVVLARRHGEYVAGAILFRGANTLYGRHWGSHGQFDGLHFELCYYQGIEYAIRHGMDTFEPGAQGEYKVARGFLPTATWSAHWIADPGFRNAIADFLTREHRYMEQYMEACRDQSPYREEFAHET